MSAPANHSLKSVTIIGAGVAGMSAACALAEAGFRVQLVERRGYLGGRASSYLHPGVSEVIDNCQHALFGAYTNLMGFYRRIGVAGKIHWTTDMTMIEPGGRQPQTRPLVLPAPLHGLPRLLTAHAFSLADKFALSRAFAAMMRPIPEYSTENLAQWLARHGQTSGAINRFWRLVHRQRPQLRSRSDQRQLRRHGHSRPVHEFARSRQHGNEHRASQRPLRLGRALP